MLSHDDLTEFIGTDLHEYKIVDQALNETCLEASKDAKYNGGVMFVNFETSNGPFQFTAYNAHNGYYGHDAAIVINNKVVHEECL